MRDAAPHGGSDPTSFAPEKRSFGLVRARDRDENAGP